jgi:hypothetical protein
VTKENEVHKYNGILVRLKMDKNFVIYNMDGTRNHHVKESKAGTARHM